MVMAGTNMTSQIYDGDAHKRSPHTKRKKKESKEVRSRTLTRSLTTALIKPKAEDVKRYHAHVSVVAVADARLAGEAVVTSERKTVASMDRSRAVVVVVVMVVGGGGGGGPKRRRPRFFG